MPTHSRSSSNGGKHRDTMYDTIDDLRTTSIFSALSPLFLSDKFSDMTVTCGGRTFKAHRVVVCSQSPFFDRAFTSSFREASSGQIDLPEDDPDVFERLLQFFYTGNYNDGVTVNLGMPAEISLLRPDEVADELAAASGVEIAHRGVKCPKRSSNSKKLKRSASLKMLLNKGDDGLGDAEDDSDDSSFVSSSDTDDLQPPSTSMRNRGQGEEPEMRDEREPEEEYNEFSGRLDDEVVEDESPDPLDKLQDAAEAHSKDYGEALQYMKRELTDRHDLFLHLRLYIMADKYDIPALKLLARERFYRAAEHTWQFSDEFPAVVDELYSTTSENEVAMREIVCRLVGHELLEPSTRERMDPIMKKHGEFAVGVMNYFLLSRHHNLTW